MWNRIATGSLKPPSETDPEWRQARKHNETQAAGENCWVNNLEMVEKRKVDIY